MVTLLDVAARAGVSRSTVSLVINKSPLVKDETRQRVERAIQELGYVPNPNARGLVKKENKSLGVIIAIEDQPYNTYEFNYETGLYSYNITNGIPVGLANTDYGLLTERFCVSIQGKELPALVKNNRVDGIFLVGGLFTPELIERLKEKKIPIIAIGRYYDQIDSVLLREYILGFGICWIKDTGKSAILIARKFTVLTRNVWREFRKP